MDYRNILNQEYITLITSALSSTTGIKVIAGNSWVANPKEKTLEYNYDDILKMDFDIAKGLLFHEIGHLKYTSAQNLQTDLQKNYPEAEHNIANALEDIRIEYLLCQEYENFASIPLTNLYNFITQVQLQENKYGQMPRLMQFLYLVIMYKKLSNGGFYFNLYDYGCKPYKKIYSFDDEVIKRYYDNRSLIEDIIVKEIELVTSTEEVQKIINDKLAPIIMDFIQDFEKQAQIDRAFSKAMADMLNRGKKALDATKRGNSPDSIGMKKQKMPYPNYIETSILYGARARILGQRIADILAERKATKYTGQYNRGKLLSKNVFKILNNEQKIFSKKNINNLPDDYVFYFAIDASGSMSGIRATNAILAGQFLNITLEQFNLPIRFYQFADQAKLLDIKKANTYGGVGGGTNDYTALELIKEDMKQYPKTTEKIIFVLTDGFISTPSGRTALLHDIEKDNGKIIGIGIATDIDIKYFRSYFPAVLYVNKPDELTNKILQVMRRIISR